jgi:NAD(P)-dependent dehydrogenase (short-subunit alcohol dehydrogenase family)
MNRLPEAYRAVVLGASGAIGSALVAALKADARCAQVLAYSRSTDPGFELENESSMAACAARAASHGPLHLVLDATGALHIDGHGPEKRLGALDPQRLARAFAVNAIGPALLLKHFVPLLATDAPVVFTTLSARVGSVEDNRIGGWYGYRASKAALNMLLQTAAIEAARTRPLAVFAALQPGTVASKLSGPFVPAADALTPAASATGMLAALDALQPTGRAQFVDYRGEMIPW